MSKHITMYGERFELVSDPFVEGEYTAVYVISASAPGIRTLRLPVSILVSPADRFPPQAKVSNTDQLLLSA